MMTILPWLPDHAEMPAQRHEAAQQAGDRDDEHRREYSKRSAPDQGHNSLRQRCLHEADIAVVTTASHKLDGRFSRQASLRALRPRESVSSMVSTIASYQLISRNLVRSLEQTARKPDVSRDTSYYLAHIGEVKSVDEFIKDYRLFSYAMKAHGLSDMTYAKAFLRKVLTEGISSSTSFANKLVDTAISGVCRSLRLCQPGRVCDPDGGGNVRHRWKVPAPGPRGGRRRSRMKASGWRSISNARRPKSRTPIKFSPKGASEGRPDRTWHFATHGDGRRRQAGGDADEEDRFRGFSESGEAADVSSALLRDVGNRERTGGVDAFHPHQSAHRDRNQRQPPWQACKTSNSEDRPHAISALCQPVGSSLDSKSDLRPSPTIWRT